MQNGNKKANRLARAAKGMGLTGTDTFLESQKALQEALESVGFRAPSESLIETSETKVSGTKKGKTPEFALQYAEV